MQQILRLLKDKKLKGIAKNDIKRVVNSTQVLKKPGWLDKSKFGVDRASRSDILQERTLSGALLHALGRALALDSVHQLTLGAANTHVDFALYQQYPSSEACLYEQMVVLGEMKRGRALLLAKSRALTEAQLANEFRRAFSYGLCNQVFALMGDEERLVVLYILPTVSNSVNDAAAESLADLHSSAVHGTDAEAALEDAALEGLEDGATDWYVLMYGRASLRTGRGETIPAYVVPLVELLWTDENLGVVLAALKAVAADMKMDARPELPPEVLEAKRCASARLLDSYAGGLISRWCVGDELTEDDSFAVKLYDRSQTRLDPQAITSNDGTPLLELLRTQSTQLEALVIEDVRMHSDNSASAQRLLELAARLKNFYLSWEVQPLKHVPPSTTRKKGSTTALIYDWWPSEEVSVEAACLLGLLCKLVLWDNGLVHADFLLRNVLAPALIDFDLARLVGSLYPTGYRCRHPDARNPNMLAGDLQEVPFGWERHPDAAPEMPMKVEHDQFALNELFLYWFGVEVPSELWGDAPSLYNITSALNQARAGGSPPRPLPRNPESSGSPLKADDPPKTGMHLRRRPSPTPSHPSIQEMPTPASQLANLSDGDDS